MPERAKRCDYRSVLVLLAELPEAGPMVTFGRSVGGSVLLGTVGKLVGELICK